MTFVYVYICIYIHISVIPSYEISQYGKHNALDVYIRIYTCVHDIFESLHAYIYVYAYLRYMNLYIGMCMICILTRVYDISMRSECKLSYIYSSQWRDQAVRCQELNGLHCAGGRHLY